MKTFGYFINMRFYFGLQIFVTKNLVTIDFFISVIFLISPHILLHFVNNYSHLTKKDMVLVLSKVFTYPLDFWSYAHIVVMSSLFW